MGMVASPQRSASAFAVFFGPHGAVSHAARARGVCRQRLYCEAARTLATLEGGPCQKHDAEPALFGRSTDEPTRIGRR